MLIRGTAKGDGGKEYPVIMDPGPTVLVNNASVYDDGKGHYFLDFFNFKYQFGPDQRPKKGERVEIEMPLEAAVPVGRFVMDEETLRDLEQAISEHLRKSKQ